MGKIAAFHKASDKQITLAEFTNPNGKFVQDERYFCVSNPEGFLLAHGVKENFGGA